MKHINLKEVESKLGAIFTNLYQSTIVLDNDTSHAMAHKACCSAMDLVVMIEDYLNSIDIEKFKPIEIPIGIVEEIEIIIKSK